MTTNLGTTLSSVYDYFKTYCKLNSANKTDLINCLDTDEKSVKAQLRNMTLSIVNKNVPVNAMDLVTVLRNDDSNFIDGPLACINTLCDEEVTIRFDGTVEHHRENKKPKRELMRRYVNFCKNTSWINNIYHNNTVLPPTHCDL